MKKSQIIISSLLLVCLASICRCIKPKQKGLVAGTAGNFKSNSLQQILAYSDLNRDGQIDILTKSSSLNLNEQSINMYIYNRNLKEYQLWGSHPSDYVSLKSALVSSFKEFQYFHIVLYYQGQLNNSIKMVPFSCSNFECKFFAPINIPQLTIAIDKAYPSLLGIMGNIGLLFHANGTSNVLLFEMNETLSYEVSPLSQYIQKGQSIGAFKYSYNGDYDGDCLTDLILLKENGASTILQFIRGNQKNQFKYIKSIIIQQRLQHFTLQDINFDGKNDLILLLASSKLQISYHKYGTDKLLCNGLHFEVLPYDFQISEIEVKQIQRVDFANSLHANSLLLFGDFNNDGYEDLSLTFMDQTGTFPQAVLLENVGCISAACGYYNPLFIQKSLTLNLRTFRPKVIPGVNQLTSRLSFVDIQQDGSLDFMFHMQVDMNGVKYMTIQAVYNNIGYDAFFLTITILTAKTAKTNLIDNTQYIGGVASFYVTLLSGELAPRTSNQLAQAGPTLQLPYIRQGLGRTNNYLQNLIITIPRSPYSQFKWTPIIPNSDILIIPPSLDLSQLEWTLQVSIEPTQKLGFVLLIVIISLGIIGAVILNLSKRQKEQDKQTQQSFYTFLR